MKTLLLAAAAASGILAASPATAGFIYVGEWHVGEGPVWTTNPTVYSAREAAALLFDGSPTDYAISTISDEIADINFMAFVDGWGDSSFLFSAVSQDYKLDAGAPGYDDPQGFGTAYSAYVLDHSCDYRYDDPSLPCEEGEPGRNFAFRIVDTPEPTAIALFGLGLLGLAGARRRRA